MKKISREEQMEKNGGVGFYDRWVGQCTTCGQAWSSDKKRQDVVNAGYNHYVAKLKKNEIHRWDWIRDNGR